MTTLAQIVADQKAAIAAGSTHAEFAAKLAAEAMVDFAKLAAPVSK